jgi:hypothetical protein
VEHVIGLEPHTRSFRATRAALPVIDAGTIDHLGRREP